MLTLVSVRLLERIGSLSSSSDLFELELRCEEVTDGVLTLRWKGMNGSVHLTTRFSGFWYSGFTSSDERFDLSFRICRSLTFGRGLGLCETAGVLPEITADLTMGLFRLLGIDSSLGRAES